MLSIVMQSVVMLSIVMQSVVKLSVVMLSFVMLCALAPGGVPYRQRDHPYYSIQV
jgi:hypothetical protein